MNGEIYSSLYKHILFFVTLKLYEISLVILVDVSDKTQK